MNLIEKSAGGLSGEAVAAIVRLKLMTEARKKIEP